MCESYSYLQCEDGNNRKVRASTCTLWTACSRYPVRPAFSYSCRGEVLVTDFVMIELVNVAVNQIDRTLA